MERKGPKHEGTRRRTTPCFVLLLSMLLLLFSVHAASATRKDELYVAMFVVGFPDAVRGINTNVVFDFNDTVGLPINTSSPAFEDVQTAYFTAYSQGLFQWGLFFDASYTSVDQDLASQYSDEACSEFLQAIGLNASITDRSSQINNQTGAVETARTIVPAPYDVETTNKLLYYRPSGIGDLITQQFLARYFLGSPEGSTGMVEVDWKLRRVAGTFQWELTFVATSVDTWLSGNETSKEITFDLDSFLKHTGTISLCESEIVIEIENATRIGSRIYTLDLTDMSPAGRISWDPARSGTVLIFDPPVVNSVDNIILKMMLNVRVAGPDWTMILVAEIVAMLAANVLGIFLYRVFRNGSKTSPSPKLEGK